MHKFELAVNLRKGKLRNCIVDQACRDQIVPYFLQEPSLYVYRSLLHRIPCFLSSPLPRALLLSTNLPWFQVLWLDSQILSAWRWSPCCMPCSVSLGQLRQVWPHVPFVDRIIVNTVTPGPRGLRSPTQTVRKVVRTSDRTSKTRSRCFLQLRPSKGVGKK